MKILMLVFNTFKNDARVHREASYLGESGHEVVVLALAHNELDAVEERQAYRVVRTEIGKTILSRIAKIMKAMHAKLRQSKIKISSTDNNPPPQDRGGSLSGHQSKRPKRIQFRTEDGQNPIIRFLYFLQRQLVFRKFHKHCFNFGIEFEPDAVHCHDFSTLRGGLQISRHFKIPLIYDSHELWVERNKAGRTGLISRLESLLDIRFERIASKHANTVITVCDSIADYLQDKYLINRPVVVRNMPLKSEHRQADSRILHRSIGIDQDLPLLVYAGKATYSRGLEDILIALQLAKSRPSFVILGYFDPQFESSFWRLVEELGLESRVYHYGPVPSEEVTYYLSSADISMVPIRSITLSYYYALPNKLFESIVAGVPVIGTNIPEIRQIIKCYECGILYDEDDKRALVAAIDRLVDNPALRDQYHAAAKMATETICWEKEKLKLGKVYQDLEILTPGISRDRVKPH